MRHTIGGIIAVLFWSSTFAVSRPLVESVGMYTATGLMYLIAGSLGSLFFLSRRDALKKLNSYSRKYLFVCGACFILFSVCLYISIGLVSTRQQMIEIGLLNYTWPALTILFSVCLFGYRSSRLLFLGLVLAFGGVVIASLREGGFHFTDFGIQDFFAYFIALTGAFLWALYSTLSKAWGEEAGPEVICLWVFIVGIIVLPLRFITGEQSLFTMEALAQLMYMSLGPTLFANVLWDSAMKRGDIVLVASISFFAPVFATVLSIYLLGLDMGWNVWIACFSVLLGSYLTNRSVRRNLVTVE